VVVRYRLRMDERREPCVSADAPFPPERAFVVQLRAQTASSAELFIGRVEHLTSGAAHRFSSADELIAFVTKVLAPDPSTDEPDDAERHDKVTTS